MTRVELIHERTPDGTIVLRPVVLGPLERLRRFVRRWAATGGPGAART